MVNHTHPILLRGLTGATELSAPGPTLLQRMDQDVIGAVLGDLMRSNGLSVIAKTLVSAGSGDSPLRLYQPVHRVFHLALLEVVCDPFGTGHPNPYQPRLDPSRIDSAGLVLRRYGGNPAQGQLEGWRTLAEPPTDSTSTLRGWIPFNHRGDNPLTIPRGTDSDLTMDPDPQRRRPILPLKAGRPELDRNLAQKSLLRLASATLSEHTSPLFVAPPEVCQALGKTLLYGLIPLTSQEFSEIQNFEQAFPEDFVQAHLPPYLKSGAELAAWLDQLTNSLQPLTILPALDLAAESRLGFLQSGLFGNAPGVAPSLALEMADLLPGLVGTAQLFPALVAAFGIAAVPRAGQRVSGRQLAAVPDPDESPDPDLDGEERLEKRLDYALIQAFLGFLRQLQTEFEAFSDRTDARALFTQLNRISLSFNDEAPQLAGDFLKNAAAKLLDSQSSETVPMPLNWPSLSLDLAAAIARPVKAILDRRLRASAPQEGRFDDLDRTYQVCAFVRVKGEAGCPTKIHWSAPSQPFTLARWYDNSPVPPVQVALPDLLGADRENALQNLKPNVTFAVPAGLFNALDGMTLQDLLDGKRPSGGGPALDWICGFNIPIITLCAFIVLNIFLQLLNFIFQWLLFIKICIPIPRFGGNDN